MRACKILLLLLAYVFTVTSCNQKVDQTLIELKSRIHNNPDSVFFELADLQSSYEDMAEGEKALFDLCKFRIASLQSENYPPIEDIERAILYFEKNNNIGYAAEGHYSKALYHKETRTFEQANACLLKALDLAQKANDKELLPRIYFDLGHIAHIQSKYDAGLEYLNKSIELFQQTNDKKREAVAYDVASMAALGQDDFELSREYSFKALNITSDSVTIGDLYSNIGSSYYYQANFDSAYYYYLQSLQYPSYSTNLSLRYYNLANLFANNRNYDSAEYYVEKALDYPIDIYVEEELYRIATDVALHKGDKEAVSEYIWLRAQCNDSIMLLEQQPNVTIINQIHQATLANQQHQTKQKYLIFSIIFLVVIAATLYIILQKKKRTRKHMTESLRQHKEALEQHQETLKDISLKMREEQDKKISIFKLELENHISTALGNGNSKLHFTEKEQVKKNAYIEFLNIENEELFKANMNYVLSSFPHKLSFRFPYISYKEVIWSCLFVLDVSTTDTALILDYTQNSQYKFKQRLIKKLRFSATKEFEQFLRDLIYVDA